MYRLTKQPDRDQLLCTNRRAMMALLTLAFFIPVAAGCADNTSPSPEVDDIESDPAEGEVGNGEEGVETQIQQYTTLEEVQQLTGMTYYTVAEEGESLVVRGYLPDATERASLTFEERPDGTTTVTLAEPGQSPQVVSLSSVPEGDGTRVVGTVGGETMSVLIAGNGQVVSGEGQPTSSSPGDAAAMLLTDFTVSQAGLPGNLRARWWKCTICAAGIAGAALLAWLIWNSGLAWPVIIKLQETWAVGAGAGVGWKGGIQAVTLLLANQYMTMPEETRKKIAAAIGALIAAGTAVITACYFCAVGEN
jgi:hypothetical protein